jgi:hypothetical protein
MKAITSNELSNELVHATYLHRAHTVHKSVWKQFIDYAEGQQDKRLFWAAVGILGHGTIFTIVTLAAVMLLGNNLFLYAIACFNMTMVVVVNLAALPTKYTIPLFILSLFIDLSVIIAAIVLHLH